MTSIRMCGMTVPVIRVALLAVVIASVAVLLVNSYTNVSGSPRLLPHQRVAAARGLSSSRQDRQNPRKHAIPVNDRRNAAKPRRPDSLEDVFRRTWSRCVPRDLNISRPLWTANDTLVESPRFTRRSSAAFVRRSSNLSFLPSSNSTSATKPVSSVYLHLCMSGQVFGANVSDDGKWAAKQRSTALWSVRKNLLDVNRDNGPSEVDLITWSTASHWNLKFRLHAEAVFDGYNPRVMFRDFSEIECMKKRMSNCSYGNSPKLWRRNGITQLYLRYMCSVAIRRTEPLFAAYMRIDAELNAPLLFSFKKVVPADAVPDGVVAPSSAAPSSSYRFSAGDPEKFTFIDQGLVRNSYVLWERDFVVAPYFSSQQHKMISDHVAIGYWEPVCRFTSAFETFALYHEQFPHISARMPLCQGWEVEHKLKIHMDRAGFAPKIRSLQFSLANRCRSWPEIVVHRKDLGDVSFTNGGGPARGSFSMGFSGRTAMDAATRQLAARFGLTVGEISSHAPLPALKLYDGIADGYTSVEDTAVIRWVTKRRSEVLGRLCHPFDGLAVVVKQHVPGGYNLVNRVDVRPLNTTRRCESSCTSWPTVGRDV